MHKVLIVEDSPTVHKLLTHFLEEKGCEVLSAHNGLEALIILEKIIPDIIITDIIMPKISGDQLCAIIRKDRRLRDIFIAVYSSTILEDQAELQKTEADIYIVKGPRARAKDHVDYVLTQFTKGVRREGKIIGQEGLHPREITRDLILVLKHYLASFDNISDAVIELNCDGQIIQANKAAELVFNKEIILLLSTKMIDYLVGTERDAVARWISEVNITGASCFRSCYNNPLIIGEKEVILNLVSFLEEEEFYIIGIFQDITLQKETERTLAKTLGEFNAVLDTIDYGVLLMDSNLKTRMYNRAVMDMWDFSEDFLNRKPTFSELIEHNNNKSLYSIPKEDFEIYRQKRLEAIRKGPIGPVEIQKADGSIYQFQCVVLPDNGRMLTYYDISDLKNTQAALAETLEQVSNLANHDTLTGLPNLRLARERLMSTLSMAKRQGWKAAIMFIDLDGFKKVNDSYGHDCGDELLKMVAKRLFNNLRQADTVARIGGDEFLIIQTEVSHRFAAANVADKIVKHMATPFHVNDIEITIGASIGISLYPEHGKDSRILLKKADDAMYYTKRIGKNGYTFTPK